MRPSANTAAAPQQGGGKGGKKRRRVGGQQSLMSWLAPQSSANDGGAGARASPIDVEEEEEDVPEEEVLRRREAEEEEGLPRRREEREPAQAQAAAQAPARASVAFRSARGDSGSADVVDLTADDEPATAAAPIPPTLEQELQRKLGHRDFRCPEQRRAVECVLAKRDCLVLMPTGMGKSLCFQLPALIMNERHGQLTVVVSPLLALMTEQVMSLKAKGKRVSMLASTITSQERKATFAELHSMAATFSRPGGMPARPCMSMLYTTPESLTGGDSILSVLHKLQRFGRLGLFAVDEAHCIASWGHDFRPAYRRLDTIKQAFPDVPCIALTATATSRVVDDMVRQLELQRPLKITMGFNRPNIKYTVVRKEDVHDVEESIVDFARREGSEGGSGIVYCHKKDTVEGLAAALRAGGVTALGFHGSTAKSDKTAALEQWLAGSVQVIVATVAFGMGIDKPDVRYVVHHDMPMSPEGLVQEAGRAGRDGKRAESRVYFSEDDLDRFLFIKQQDEDTEKVRKACARLHQVADWCQEPGCHREKLLSFFSERKPPGVEDEHCCANCERKSNHGARRAAASGPSAAASARSVRPAASGSFRLGGARPTSFSRGTKVGNAFRPPRRIGDAEDSGSSEEDRDGGSGGFRTASAMVAKESARPRGQDLMNLARERAGSGSSAPAFRSASAGLGAGRSGTGFGGLQRRAQLHPKKKAARVDLF